MSVEVEELKTLVDDAIAAGLKNLPEDAKERNQFLDTAIKWIGMRHKTKNEGGEFFKDRARGAGRGRGAAT